MLVLAMMLVPMTAFAADNTSPEMSEQLWEADAQITVAPGETLYYMYRGGNDKDLYIDGKGQFAVTPIVFAGFQPVAGDSVDALPTAEEPYYYSMMYLSANMQGLVGFGITNKSNETQTYMATLSDPLGSGAYPDWLVQGDNEAVVRGGSMGYTSIYYPVKAGEVTITMSDDNAKGWKYIVYVNGEPVTYENWSNDSTVVATSTVQVAADDEVRVWVNTLTDVAGTVNYQMTYSASEKDDVVFTWKDIYVGENDLVLDGTAITSVYAFGADETGVYEITAPAGCKVSYWGTNPYNLVKESSNETNTYVLQYKEAGPSVLIGISGAATAVVEIKKTGEIQQGGTSPSPDVPKYTDYKNSVSPIPYEFKGDANKLFYVWLEEGTNPTAVLGDDGYYHLGSKTGPVLYVDLNMDMHPFADSYIIAGLQKIAGENKLYNPTTKIDYSTAIKVYAIFADSKTGLYPVTEDIKEVIVEYGEGQWWYNPEGPAYLFENKEIDEDSMWLFMCCYEGSVDKVATHTKFELGSKDGFVYKVNAEYTDFAGLKIDGKEVAEKYFTVKEGSTVITVSADFMNTLAAGTHTVSAIFINCEGDDVAFETKVTVAAPATKEEKEEVANKIEEATNKIEEAIKEAEKSESTSDKAVEVVVDMKTESGAVVTEIPVEILETVKGQNVDVVFDMGEYSWTINGNDISAEKLEAIDLEVKLDSANVPENVVASIAGDKEVKQLELTHNGDFGFTATLTINVGKDNEGMYGNLYYYNKDGKLEFVSAGKIDKDGNVALDFTHASDYVVVIDDKAVEAPKTGDNTNFALWIAVLGLGVVAMAGSVVMKKREF